MSVKLFENVQLVRDELVKNLTKINENIDWNEFINKYASKNDESIMKRLKTLLWIDKNIDYDVDNLNLNVKYYTYYTNLLMKFYPILHKGPIGIIALSNEFIPDELRERLEHRINIVKEWLNLRGFVFEEIYEFTDINKFSIIIPTGSVSWPDISEKLSNFNGLIVPDDCWNICYSENDRIINEIMIRVDVMNFSNLDINEILQCKYNMLMIKKH